MGKRREKPRGMRDNKFVGRLHLQFQLPILLKMLRVIERKVRG